MFLRPEARSNVALDGDRPPVPAKKVRSTCRFHEASFDVTIEAGGSGPSTVRRREGDTAMRFMSIFRISRAIIPYLLERGMSYLLEHWWGLNGDTARRLGPLLSQGCQFAFVLLAADAIQGVMGEPTANLLKLAVTLRWLQHLWMPASTRRVEFPLSVRRAPNEPSPPTRSISQRLIYESDEGNDCC